ncbi:hypothetical protein [Streptosporangium sp. NPDC000396]|uniref:hypothetical protein n=1 Tax=Streptosporangium sp. NPDC000396 TaxID=3366185 RepID=UPI00368957D0
MSMLEEDLRQIMADETARLHAAPDLVQRVIRSSRRRKTARIRLTATAAAVAVAAVATPVYLTLGAGSGPVAKSADGGPAAATAVAEPPLDDVLGPPLPTAVPETRDLGDLGDGRAFGRVRVDYLPEGLQWSHWSLDHGDSYTTAWDYDGNKNGFYCVQIFVYEGKAVQELDDRVRSYREEGEGKDVAVGDDRTGYMVTQNVGEDGGKGTPTVFVNLGDERRAEIMFSPVFVKKLRTEEAVARELVKVATGLSSTD